MRSWPRRARRRSGSRMTTVRVFAPAKINLTLHVVGRRTDGYHLLDSLVTFADVGDALIVSRGRGGLTLAVRGPEATGVPVDESNLALRAAAILAEADGASLELVKSLPVASGIGGGSADAAAALRAMMALRGIGRTALSAGFEMRAAEILALGADVPMCLFPRPLRARGIGERIDAVALPTVPAVLVNPRVALPTADVFRALERRDNPAMPETLPSPGDAPALAAWLGDCRNDLEGAAIRVQPVVATVLAALEATGCLLARMSGSGATCFGLYTDPAAAARAAARIRDERQGWWVAETMLGDQTARAGSCAGVRARGGCLPPSPRRGASEERGGRLPPSPRRGASEERGGRCLQARSEGAVCPPPSPRRGASEERGGRLPPRAPPRIFVARWKREGTASAFS
jgi:4-diphosphocytidyl-2-C-methyl-D-erythritol kinase